MGNGNESPRAATRELRARRREVLRFLGAFGLAAPSAALVSAIDGALQSASAQAAAGQPVPRLGVYLPNWPDQVELWRQLSREWQPLGIELDLQQGTLDTFVSQIVAEQKLPHMGSMSWGGAPDRLDPDYFLSEMFHSRRTARGGLNFGFYRNEAFDKLADAQRAEMDPAKRQQLGEWYAAGFAAMYGDPDAALARLSDSEPSYVETTRKVISSAQYLADHMGEVPVHVIPVIEGRTDGLPVAWQAAVWGSLLPAAWSFMLAARSRGLGTCFTTLHLMQEQAAAFLASDGALFIPPQPARYFEFPIPLPLPEGLNYRN